MKKRLLIVGVAIIILIAVVIGIRINNNLSSKTATNVNTLVDKTYTRFSTTVAETKQFFDSYWKEIDTQHTLIETNWQTQKLDTLANYNVTAKQYYIKPNKEIAVIAIYYKDNNNITDIKFSGITNIDTLSDKAYKDYSYLMLSIPQSVRKLTGNKQLSEHFTNILREQMKNTNGIMFDETKQGIKFYGGIDSKGFFAIDIVLVNNLDANGNFK